MKDTFLLLSNWPRITLREKRHSFFIEKTFNFITLLTIYLLQNICCISIFKFCNDLTGTFLVGLCLNQELCKFIRKDPAAVLSAIIILPFSEMFWILTTYLRKGELTVTPPGEFYCFSKYFESAICYILSRQF